MNTGFYWYIGANLGKMCFLHVLQGLTNTLSSRHDLRNETAKGNETNQKRNQADNLRQLNKYNSYYGLLHPLSVESRSRLENTSKSTHNFSQTIPMFFNRPKSDFILVRSSQIFPSD